MLECLCYADPRGEIEECKVLDGIIINKDLSHPKMRRIIHNPRIILLDTYASVFMICFSLLLWACMCARCACPCV